MTNSLIRAGICSVCGSCVHLGEGDAAAHRIGSLQNVVYKNIPIEEAQRQFSENGLMCNCRLYQPAAVRRFCEQLDAKTNWFTPTVTQSDGDLLWHIVPTIEQARYIMDDGDVRHANPYALWRDTRSALKKVYDSAGLTPAMNAHIAARAAWHSLKNWWVKRGLPASPNMHYALKRVSASAFLYGMALGVRSRLQESLAWASAKALWQPWEMGFGCAGDVNVWGEAGLTRVIVVFRTPETQETS